MTGNPRSGGNVGEQKTLIAFMTKGGVTGENAEMIADILRGEFGHHVTVVNMRRQKVPDLAPFDNVVVGTGVRIQTPYRKAKKLLRNKGLADKKVAIFISSAEAGDDPESATAKYEKKLCGKVEHMKPVACQAFGGRMPFGDKTDWTDPETVKEWAYRLGEILKYPD
jgi:menaquinone-dependent protoporphyrinogen IX oxidase